MRASIVASLVLGLVGLAGPAAGKNVAFFDNPTYTDVAQESARLAASLTELGHTVSSFSGITAADWQAATAAADLLVIPELDVTSLFPDLDAAARTALADYVSKGGALLMFDRSGGETPALLNGVFGFALAAGAGGATTRNDAAVTGTAFAGGPATLPDSNATEPVATASLPAYALSAYDDGAGNTSVFVAQFGKGRIGFLGFDWFEDPAPAEWEQALGAAVEEVTTPVVPPPDHFQCYQAKDLKNPKFVRQLDVALEDEFAAVAVDLKKPSLVCSPAGLDGSVVGDPDTHMCCYTEAGAPKLSPAPEVETTDVLGSVQVQLKKGKLFCTPCTTAPLMP